MLTVWVKYIFMSSENMLTSDRDMKPCLICLKTNQTDTLNSSNAAEQMICPLKQTEMMYLFSSQEGTCRKRAVVGFYSYPRKS